MRLVVLFVALMVPPAFAPAFAQSDSSAVANDRAAWHPTARGVRLLGGSASASAFVNNRTSLAVAPQVGLFVRDGLALSLRVGLSGARASYTGVDLVGGVPTELDIRTTSLSASLGPAVTQYIGGAGARLYPFVGASVGAYVSRSSSSVNDGARDVSRDWSLNGAARAGVMVPIARNVGIEAQIIGSLYDLSPEIRGDIGFSAGISTFLY